MTLIHLQSRIHFADDVLEEALRGEIEAAEHMSLLVLFDGAGDNRLAARARAGIPNRVAATFVEMRAADTKEATWARVRARVDPTECDAVVAFGSANAIAHGRKCRVELANIRYQRIRPGKRAMRRTSLLPDYIVVPGVDGLPDPCSAKGSVGLFRGVPPSVVICDPTLTVDADSEHRAGAYATALARCIQTLGQSAFNPVADAFATEGLRRLVLAGIRVRDRGNLGQSRELMAAALSGALAQQKGVGAIQIIAETLEDIVGKPLETGALSRILLPPLTGGAIAAPTRHAEMIRHVFGFPEGRALDDCLVDLLAPLPLKRSLKEMDLSRSAVGRAAEALSQDSRAAPWAAGRIETLLDAVY